MNKGKYIIGILVLAMLVTVMLPAARAANPVARTTTVATIGTSGTTRGVTESRVIESAHPYTNNYDYTWTVTKSGATRIRIHFVTIDVESNYDFVYTYQGTTQLNKYTGLYSSGVWSSWATGDTIKVRLKTDVSITKYGFKTDLIEYETGTTAQPLTSGTTVTETLTATGDSDMWYIDVSSGATSMRSVLTSPSGSDFDLYGKLGAFPTTALYDWRGYTSGGEDVTFNNPGAGRWYIMPYSYSGSGTYQLTVTLTYGSSVQPLTSGTPVSGSLTATGDSDMWYIDVTSGATSMRSVLASPSGADFDLYGKLGAYPTTSLYDWRGYTTGSEDVTFNNPGAGRWYIMPYSYSGSGTYQLTVTVTYGGGDGGDGVIRKYAIIVGISDYKTISDLSYCDEDAMDWYNQLVSTLTWSSANVKVYGDGHTANYPKYDGIANEYNVKQALNWLVSTADADDIISFISSGHGSGNGLGSSYLCMWDSGSGESGEDGNLYDTELKAILQNAVAAKILVFLDHCYSGGFGPDLMAMGNSAKVYCTTTCTENGYGYDDSSHLNGAWTYYFLEYSWISHYGGATSTALENVFSYALGSYPYSGGDTPQQYDGNTGAYFYLQ